MLQKLRNEYYIWKLVRNDKEMQKCVKELNRRYRRRVFRKFYNSILFFIYPTKKKEYEDKLNEYRIKAIEKYENSKYRKDIWGY